MLEAGVEWRVTHMTCTFFLFLSLCLCLRTSVLMLLACLLTYVPYQLMFMSVHQQMLWPKEAIFFKLSVHLSVIFCEYNFTGTC